MPPTNPKDQDPGLFPIEAVLPSYEGRETDYSSDERLGNLIEALNLYDEVAETEAVIRKFGNRNWLKEQQEALGKNVAYKWRRQKHEKHQELLDGAKQAFFRAYTPESFMARGMSEQEAVAELNRQYATFEQAYRGTSQGRHRKRQAAREEYRRYLAGESGEAATIPEASRPAPETPVTKALAKNAIQSTMEPELATTKDKLIGLRDDARAGFLPATHTEKNQAFEILDYMDNLRYPTGVNKRLDEIFRHQQKIADDNGIRGREKYDYAVDSIRSVVNEWADHLHEAIQSHAELTKLQELLDSGISPRINLVEATEPEDDQTFDYNVLVRFVDLKGFRDGNTLPFDPLRTKEDRTIAHDTKNKIIENQYTAVGSLPEIQDYIDEAAEKLSVKDGRQLIKEALRDQAARRLFWYRAIRAVDQEGFKELAEQALHDAMQPAS